MKLANFVTALSLLIFASLLQAQEVKPANLTIVAVPGYASSPQDVRFFNTGNNEIELTVGVSAPFALSGNRCGKGVRAHSHCDVWVIYIPQALGTDSGTLTFTFNGQNASVPITGNALSIIPTSMKARYSSKSGFLITLSAEGDVVPDGEQVFVDCIDYEGINEKGGSGPLKGNKATVSFRLPPDKWECNAWYNGDPEFASSSYSDFWIHTK